MSLRRALIIPDCHRPFHSRRAYNLMLEVASGFSIDEIILLGDYGEFGAVSTHSRHPSLPAQLQKEVEAVIEGLDELDRFFPKAKKVYLEGNHEYRLERYLTDKAPALFGLTTCRELFQMHRRPLWSYKDYGKNQQVRVLQSDLYARHTPILTNVMSGLLRAGVSYCFGHIHRIVQVQASSLDGRELIAFSPGWLGDPRLRPFDYMQVPDQWAWGFAFVTVDGSSKQFHHEIVQIKRDYSCITHGKRFKG